MDKKTLETKVHEIVNAITSKTHSLIIVLTTKSDTVNVTNGIWRLENRLIVRNFLTRPNSKSIKNQSDRLFEYRCLGYHVLVMYPTLFKKDDKYIKAIAKVNKILVMQDGKENYTLYNP